MKVMKTFTNQMNWFDQKNRLNQKNRFKSKNRLNRFFSKKSDFFTTLLKRHNIKG